MKIRELVLIDIFIAINHINHAKSKKIIEPFFPEFGIEFRFSKKILKEMANIHARLTNQNKIEYQTVFSARFDRQGEDYQVLDETKLFINLKKNHNLSESDFDNSDIRSPLEQQIQNQGLKDSGWSFDKINSMTIYVCKIGEMNGISYTKIPLRSSAILNIGDDEKFCFIWSILASLHPCVSS